jgi:single-stranded-DNA-specific exonuclease
MATAGEMATAADIAVAANLGGPGDVAVAVAATELTASVVPSSPATPAIIVVSGPWPVGIIGLVAGRLADERGVPAVVFSTSVDPWRGSARSVPGFDLAAAFTACGDLFERFGGHPAAAGCHLTADRYDAFRARITVLASRGLPSSVTPAASRALRLDLVLRAESADYVLLKELAPLDEGADEPPLVGLVGFVVMRARPAKGGHTQLTLRRGREVLDAICFGRSDLAETLSEGQEIDLVARLSSRTFAGYESLQLDVRDVAPAGTLRRLANAGLVTENVALVPVLVERAQALPVPR